jgi:hypothetical protein
MKLSVLLQSVICEIEEGLASSYVAEKLEYHEILELGRLSKEQFALRFVTATELSKKSIAIVGQDVFALTFKAARNLGRLPMQMFPEQLWPEGLARTKLPLKFLVRSLQNYVQDVVASEKYAVVREIISKGEMPRIRIESGELKIPIDLAVALSSNLQKMSQGEKVNSSSDIKTDAVMRIGLLSEDIMERRARFNVDAVVKTVSQCELTIRFKAY